MHKGQHQDPGRDKYTHHPLELPAKKHFPKHAAEARDHDAKASFPACRTPPLQPIQKSQSHACHHSPVMLRNRDFGRGCFHLDQIQGHTATKVCLGGGQKP